jgi:hypothetical protein
VRIQASQAKTKAEASLEQEIFQGEERSVSSGEHNYR